MQITKIEMTNGDIFFCKSVRKLIQKFMKKHKGKIAKMIRLTMTKAEFQNIPATFEAQEAFA